MFTMKFINYYAKFLNESLFYSSFHNDISIEYLIEITIYLLVIQILIISASSSMKRYIVLTQGQSSNRLFIA